MKRFSIYTCGTGLVLVTLLMVAGTTTAENAEKTQYDNQATQRHGSQQYQKSNFGQLDNVTRGSHFRVSQIIGTNIYNTKDESVGEVKDVVLDANTGRIGYAAVTYGGFLGIGDKMFAVPWEAFQVKTDKNDRDDYHLCLDVSQEKLEGAKGFDQDNWPNFADQNWAQELDNRYGVERRHRAAKPNLSNNRDSDFDNDRDN